MIIKDHKCISFCSKRRFTSNFHQLKNKRRNKSAYKGINIIKKGYFFEDRLKSLKKGFFEINLV